ncbi:MAG: M1 family metallopeptidase [Bacteroidetes bacterium]|nr:M1 family metallopeptidase [Bacteroidota bacterium]
MSLKSILVISVICISAVSCKWFKHKQQNPEPIEWNFEDPSVLHSGGEEWHGSNEILFSSYRGTKEKIWDLEHTALELHFNFSKRMAMGKAELFLHPHYLDQDSLVLDAKALMIGDVTALDSNQIKSKSPTAYHLIWKHRNSKELIVYLHRKYKRNESLHLVIYYASNSYGIAAKGNDAITEDRGLYFINHDLEQFTKPRQIWSQGETESNSKWFPTLDAPNQKTTLNIKLHVPDTMVSLSNGKLIRSYPSDSPGLRVDQWEQTQPHAPYLTMIAIGNWSVTKDQWRGKEVNYLVEKKYAKYAPMIFGNTPKMMEFFSNYLGVDFVWDKYSQVVVRDFVSGAMENTSATVHMEALQHDSLQHLDNSYEDYISHELFHQWFGDLVTTESWSNITLNESFATYGEYLWREFYYGKSNAESLLVDLRNQYDFAGSGEGKKLVRYEYEDEGELFDNISYQKGGCILHMLRNTVGDDAFRESLKLYLNIYRFQSAEVANLRMAFEEVTGKDLNWFFNQWYLDDNHPKIQLIYSETGLYNTVTEKTDSIYKLQIEQTQDNRNCYVFPAVVRWKNSRGIFNKKLFIGTRNFVFDFGNEKPEWFVFDTENSLLCEEKIIYSNLGEALKQLQIIHQAWDQPLSDGVKYRMFLMACKIAEELDEGKPNEDLRIALMPIYKKAIHSGFDPILQKAFQFGVNHPWYLQFTESRSLPDVEYILENKRYMSDTRIAALNLLYYSEYSDEKLMHYISDSALTASTFIIGRLKDKLSWVPVAKVQTEKAYADIAIAWMNKLVWNNEYQTGDALMLLANNPRVDAENFDRALNILFYESSHSLMQEQFGLLLEKLKKNGRQMQVQVIKSRLYKEIGRKQQQLDQADSDQDGDTENTRELLQLYQQIYNGI